LKITDKKSIAGLLNLAGVIHKSELRGKYDEGESPLRAELFGIVQMEEHGKVLARSHKINPGKAKDLLLNRLADNEIILSEACNLLTVALKEGRQISPAAEWLLDNFYLIEEQIRTAKRHLPKGYSKELPRLTGITAYPRVYDIALETISHGDGRVDPEGLSRFVASYQQVTPLTVGELWAIPIMLRLALIENLRRVAARLVANRINSNLADSWADQMVDTVEKDPSKLILLVADMARSDPPMVGSFVAELARRLQGQGPALSLPLTWIAPRLSEIGLTVEQLIQIEGQQKAADQVSISNSIGSLRLLGKMDWREFVESMSEVDKVLVRDPNNGYRLMDFSTRDCYRHVIENISRRSKLSEVEIAEHAISLAEQGAREFGNDSHNAHVGYYLRGAGLTQLELAVPMKFTMVERVCRSCKRSPLLSYLGAISILGLLILAAVFVKTYGEAEADWKLVVLVLLSVIGVSQLAINLVNWAVTIIVTPHQLPRMDFSKGITPQCKTLVTIPSMLTSLSGIDDLCEGLEVRFLANKDEYIFYCLLTDFLDAATETHETDTAFLQHVKQRIEQLNAKYSEGGVDKFFLLHRSRSWNAQEKIWMGHERKRGKLANLNGFLRGTLAYPFDCMVGNTVNLSDVKYVITLDTDTLLPRESARQMIATIAHPLNQARFNPAKQRIIAGYGILQPRVSASLPPTDASVYQRLCSGDTGIDPYTQAASDVYQDIFGEGSFIGKGIYNIDAFEQSISGKFPDNQILSHDLLEGCYARSGLISDVHVFEDYPKRYKDDVRRRHRWMRGDWQLIPWLLPRFVRAKVELPAKSNPLSLLSRWKLLDNVRRSLVSVSLVALLVCGWIVSPVPLFWSGLVLGLLLIPPLIASLHDLMRKSNDILVLQHLNASLRSTKQHLFHAALTLVFLPYDAYYSMDAILRALWRMTISHRRLLEWIPSAQTVQLPDSLLSSIKSMWFASALAIGLFAVLVRFHPLALIAAAPFLLVWLFAPFIAWFISEPHKRSEAILEQQQTVFLFQIARKVWSYYEVLVGAEDNWLPPDNIQERPVAVIAHRTSPTNIGLALLANLTAHDFAYVSLRQLLERSANTLYSMSVMERHRGHFYNWYDTETLKPLLPMYISTVDSGNLAGHLLTLRPGLLMLVNQPIVNLRLIGGIADTFAVFQTMAGASSQAELMQFQGVLDETVPLVSLSQTQLWLQKLIIAAKTLETTFSNKGNDQMTWWVQALVNQCNAMYDELLYLAPWSALINSLEKNDSFAAIDTIPSLRKLAELEASWRSENQSILEHASEEVRGLVQMLSLGSQRAATLIKETENLAMQAAEFAKMDYTFLYDKSTHLMTIGYNVGEQRCDTSFYDLLASEARLCTFVMIALGQLPQESWFALGRQLTVAGGDPILLSWSGSMFEYLMPLLVMPTFENTLLDQTYHSVVQRQIDYGMQRDVPWGISESSYHTFDANLNYQYRAFGVPGLGLKRGLGDDLVVAPYATMLALMVAPEQACTNLQRLAREGFEGKFGLYEAIDYTASRLPRGQTHALIQSFMAHHQGMGLLALAYYLLDRPMQKRFESDPLFQATMLLLQEKIPKASAFYSNTIELADIRTDIDEQSMPMRIINRHDTRVPEVQLLSNGRYNVMVTNSGGNSSRWKELALTRWRENGASDNWGSFCYIRDCEADKFWSTTYQPTLVKPDNYEVIFSEGRAEFRRRDNNIDMHTEMVVSPEDDIEMRRTHITNRSNLLRTIEVTSYAEIVLAPAAADAAHPAFSNLFVQTEIMEAQKAILCSRRPRSSDEKMPCMFTLMVAHGEEITQVSFETDRARFLGRGNTTQAPDAMRVCGRLSGSQGSVLDPVASIRFQIALAPQQTAVIDFVIGASENREDALHLINKYQDRFLADRVFELAWTHSQVVLRQLNATETDAQLYARLAGSVIYQNDQLRAEASILLKNRRGQSGLWSYAISGDLPIVLVQIKNLDNIDLVRQMVQAHSYWRLKGLAVDLVIWNEDHASYRQVLQDQIMAMIASGIEAHSVDRPGGIFVRLADQMSSEDRILMQSVARVVLCDSRGSLAEQLNRRGIPELRMPLLIPSQPRPPGVTLPAHPEKNNLLMFNGLGGFTPEGHEYVIATESGITTPAPWVNILANPQFGTVISESGQAYTWGENAHEFRLTPWNNDSISDSCGEAFYLRDEETGHFWSPTPLPCRGEGPYITRHGHGYSVFEHTEDGVHSELWVYVALDAPIKYSVLKIRNDSQADRKLSATGYVEWVLGDLQSKSAMHIVTESDPVSGAIFAHNAYNTEFADRIAFFDVDAVNRSISADRVEFLGRNGNLSKPAALQRTRLTGKVGAGLDPCAAIQVPFELGAGQEREIVFMLGVAGRRSADVSNLVYRYRGALSARKALDAVNRYWQHTLGAVQIDTPDPAVNLLANGWLMYQTIACRLWARSGFYQSGGAYGFRDQLQDVMAMIHTEPHLTREHILLSAAHQFVEGDVMHWWHPPLDRGVRTHCSDDYLWLPLAVCRYVQSTGDTGILDENIHFVEGRQVSGEEDSYYDLPTISPTSGTLYEHCLRSIAHSRTGVHGLPLIGSCDWNDGMDKVGAGGKGESVWLGFFLYDVLMRFTEVAKIHGDAAYADKCVAQANELQRNIEANAWDGNWYRRAYFDDGTPLGSISNAECQIDSLSQSWAVLSGAGEKSRTETAMRAVANRLVQGESGLIQLLDPPFDHSSLNPGYIKGYAPGVRENGGQYTHAAVWTIMAFAKMGDAKRAWELVDMINPINHSRTARDVDIYKVEPYVMAADVYAVDPHKGRGGWTWYTGSAGWMYRLIIESLLGLHLESNTLTVKPCIPATWKRFTLTYRYRETSYLISISQTPSDVTSQTMRVDGIQQEDCVIYLKDDVLPHTVDIVLMTPMST
jgi:cellobiose phosphorylase